MRADQLGTRGRLSQVRTYGNFRELTTDNGMAKTPSLFQIAEERRLPRRNISRNTPLHLWNVAILRFVAIEVVAVGGASSLLIL
jgi:hypothetical protein